MTFPPFLGLRPPVAPEKADVLLLPLPFDETACYGKGTRKEVSCGSFAMTHGANRMTTRL